MNPNALKIHTNGTVEQLELPDLDQLKTWMHTQIECEEIKYVPLPKTKLAMWVDGYERYSRVHNTPASKLGMHYGLDHCIHGNVVVCAQAIDPLDTAQLQQLTLLLDKLERSPEQVSPLHTGLWVKDGEGKRYHLSVVDIKLADGLFGMEWHAVCKCSAVGDDQDVEYALFTSALDATEWQMRGQARPTKEQAIADNRDRPVGLRVNSYVMPFVGLTVMLNEARQEAQLVTSSGNKPVPAASTTHAG